MKEETISRIAIILLALVMAVFGIYHFVHPKNLLAYVPSFLPSAGNLWVYLPGIGFILAAIAFITNIKVRLAAYLLAILLIIFVITIHIPNYMYAGDPAVRQGEFVNALKDTALAAFALHIGANSTT